MSSSSSNSTSTTLRQTLLPCVLSAGTAALLTWTYMRLKYGREVNRQSLLSQADAATAGRHGLTPSEFNEAAHQLVDQVTQYRATLRDRPVKSQVEPGYLKALVPSTAPEQGETWSAIQSDIERVIMPGITHWGSPNFFAYFPAYASYPSLLGEFLCSSLNTIGFSWIGSPASTELETLCLDWIGQMAQLPKEFLHSSELGGGGCIQGTAAEAGSVALLAAKQKAFEGLTPAEAEIASQHLVAYISDQTHGIIAKGCKITGIPESRLRVLPTSSESNFGLKLSTVQQAFAADIKAGHQPFFICLTIGSTSSTAIDDVAAIAEWISNHHPRVFIHIDSAYAGSFSILPSHRHLFQGLEFVDSFSFNPHKSLLIAFDCSLFYVRSRKYLLTALSLVKDGEYLRNAATESGKVLDLKDWQLPFGRRFRSLKLWFTLRSYGQVGIRRHLESAIENAERFKNHIRTSLGRFKLRCEPLQFGLVCFEVVPPFAARLTRAEINALNERLKEVCNATGRIFFISTVLEGQTILRLACNGESQQSVKDCDRAWKVIEEEADKIWTQNGWIRPTSVETLHSRQSSGSFTSAVASSTSSSSSSSSSTLQAATVPVIDISSLRDPSNSPAALEGRARVSSEIYAACTTWGFFYIKGHGISEDLQTKLETLSKQFFALPTEEKAKISMGHAGIAWRGWFPCGDELTSGKPDQKEGLYLGTELGPNHPKVKAGIPMHGANLFPDEVLPELRPTVLQYISDLTTLGHLVMEGVADSLKLNDRQYFRRELMADPTVLFRIFNYPEHKGSGERGEESWGVGAHTDYGVLTILKQDDSGGLQVQNLQGEWIPAPPIPGTFVCNIGDMLDRLTGGRFKSTLHRVRNQAKHDRLSFPFFFDPSWDSEVKPIPLDHLPEPVIKEDQQQRWDKASVHTLSGTYGQYLLRKVGKVFPSLEAKVLRNY